MQPKSEMACACLWLYTEVSRCCVIMKGSDQHEKITIDNTGYVVYGNNEKKR